MYFSQTEEFVNSVISMRQYLSSDVYAIELEFYEPLTEIASNSNEEDEIEDTQAMEVFWSRNFSYDGQLGTTIRFLSGASGPAEINLILGQAYRFSNLDLSELATSDVIYVSQDFTDAEIESIKTAYPNAIFAGRVPNHFYFNDTNSSYIASTRDTVYYFTTSLENANTEFSIREEQYWDRLIAYNITDELSIELKEYVWNNYEGHCKILPFGEKFTSEQLSYNYGIILEAMFTLLSILAVYLLCIAIIRSIFKKRMPDYVIYRQFGARRSENYISLCLYIFSFFIVPILLQIVFTYYTIYIPIVANNVSVFVLVLFILVVVLTSVFLAKSLNKEIENQLYSGSGE